MKDQRGFRPVVPALYSVRVQPGVRIPMRDGICLSARIVSPVADKAFPAVIIYHPYRKDDFAFDQEAVHRHLAERGIVGVQLDVRGTGSSEGRCTDEYLPVEQQDGFDAVEWLAAQPWCNGRIGMWGCSYSGFTAIQVAMQRPPHLKAIFPMCATDDRYADDCHYSQGGSLRMYYDVGFYGGFMVALNALPPLESELGEQWAASWMDRLQGSEPFILQWIKHQVDSDYWRGASLRPRYERIECPVYLVGGWRDGYVNAMMRMYRELSCPKWLLIGPWSHNLPSVSIPGPRIDFINEMARFFLHYLAQEDTSFETQPAVTVYMQEDVKPGRTAANTPGNWREDAGLPDQGSNDLVLFLTAEGGMTRQAPSDSFAHSLDYRPTLGTGNGYWSGGGLMHYLAADQREDEAFSLTYTSEPFTEDQHLLGWPEVVLLGSSSVPVMTFVAKLSDVAPDGKSTLIVDGSLNGTRRDSLTTPSPLEPGRIYELRIPMNPTGWVLKTGHRLRLAVSCADFPNLWPTPEAGSIRVVGASNGFVSRVRLPRVTPADSASAPAPFLPPPALPAVLRSNGEFPRQEITVDQINSTVTARASSGRSVVLPDGARFDFRSRYECVASAIVPAEATVHGVHTFRRASLGDIIETKADCMLRSSATALHLSISLEVRRNGEIFFQRQWTSSEPRRLL